MKKEFELLKNEFAKECKKYSPCSSEYSRLLNAKDEAEVLKVIFDNFQWCVTNKVISTEFFNKFDKDTFINSGIANTGQENTGFINSGDRNSGDRNSGDSNSGNWNSGDRNSGNWNSGYWNSGDRNSGDSNSGDRNSGDRNSGYRNSGYRNSGDSNSGYWNSGDRNSGNWNSGDRNSGYSNSGYRNSGNWNSGDRNSGDSNSGYRNSGAFCTDNDPVLYLFNKPTKIKVREWESHKAISLMYSIDFTLWVPSNMMTDQEKKDHPKYETTEGYLKTIPIKEAWSNFWHNLTEENKKVFTSLPNFDDTIFEEITGIKI